MLFVVMLFLTTDWVLSIFALVSFPYAGLLAFYQYKFSRKLKNFWRWKILGNTNPDVLEQLLKQRHALLNQLKIWEL